MHCKYKLYSKSYYLDLGAIHEPLPIVIIPDIEPIDGLAAAQVYDKVRILAHCVVSSDPGVHRLGGEGVELRPFAQDPRGHVPEGGVLPHRPNDGLLAHILSLDNSATEKMKENKFLHIDYHWFMFK